MYQNSRKILSILSAISLLVLPFAPSLTLSPQIAKAQSGNLFTNPSFTGNNSGWLTGVHGIPDGWILAPGDSNYSTGDFLVMQYEGKAWDLQEGQVVSTGGASSHWAGNNSQTRYRTISMPEGNPWRYISQNHGSNYDAIEACGHAYQMADLPNGSTHLITNDEWMTLARNIEAQSVNWADGVIGSTVSSGGGLFRGNNGLNDSAGYNGDNPESGTGRNTKARHILSSGEEIWDLSGNVYEWTNNTIQRQHQPLAWDGVNDDSSGFDWSDFTTGGGLTRFIKEWKAGGLQYDQVGPADDTLNASHGVGRVYHYSLPSDSATNVYAYLRGGVLVLHGVRWVVLSRFA